MLGPKARTEVGDGAAARGARAKQEPEQGPESESVSKATPQHHGPEHQTDQWSHYRLVLNTEHTVSSRLFFGQDRGLENIPQSPL